MADHPQSRGQGNNGSTPTGTLGCQRHCEVQPRCSSRSARWFSSTSFRREAVRVATKQGGVRCCCDVVVVSGEFDSESPRPRGPSESIRAYFPEALPKRYGLYEPPQHVYAETGMEHFLRFLDENLHDMKVWYPRRPVASVHLGMPNPVGAHNLGFRTNHLSIEIEKNAVSEPGWATTLKRFWRKASQLICPIYGDVRILQNYQWMGATVSAGQQHPVKSWWWAGIPEELRECCCARAGVSETLACIHRRCNRS